MPTVIPTIQQPMSNSEFADAIGCHVTTASRYRNGHRLPGVELLEAMRQALGVDHDELLKVWEAGTAHKRAGRSPRTNPFGRYLRRHVFEDAA